MDAGLIGAIAGSSVGLMGGAVGTWLGIRSAGTPAERRVLIRYAIGMWIGLALFLALLVTLPKSYFWIPWTVYIVALPASILACNRACCRARAIDAAVSPPRRDA